MFASTGRSPSTVMASRSTPTLDVIAGVFDVDREAITVEGDRPVDANMHVTQVVDGQYHASTIEANETVQERINDTIEQACAVHERVLVVGEQKVKWLLDLPENADWLHYHATRGLNRQECDAVICVGAPHPDVWALERNARLLAMNRDVRVGGEEHSTRRGPDGELAKNPPVYRSLLFEDDDGRGRAVPTKHYSGLVGRLFRGTREDELRQTIHRIRPALAGETQHVYLLTNVPTDVPVDDLVTFDELSEPMRAILNVPEGAVQLLKHVHDLMRGNGPDGIRADTLVRERSDGEIVCNKRAFHRLARLEGMAVTYETVSNWVNALAEWRLLDAGEYEQRRGVRFRAERATFEAALSCLTGNGGFKVAARRRLRGMLEGSGFTDDVLDWLREVFVIDGAADLSDPPPDPT
jgi:hypothetical protein